MFYEVSSLATMETQLAALVQWLFTESTWEFQELCGPGPPTRQPPPVHRSFSAVSVQQSVVSRCNNLTLCDLSCPCCLSK